MAELLFFRFYVNSWGRGKIEQIQIVLEWKLRYNFYVLQKGKVYCSYLTAGGFMGSIDTINYDERYPKLVKICEEDHNCLVYHVIESEDLLAMLFVQKDYANRLMENRITAIVVNAQFIPFEVFCLLQGWFCITFLQFTMAKPHFSNQMRHFLISQ